MNIIYFIGHAAILATGGAITVSVLWFLVRNDLKQYLENRPAAGNTEQNNLLSLRLQAHERLIVFTDRINPSNLFIRLHQPGIAAKTLQAHILNEIRSEYQHNVAQQLYIASVSWKVISKLKEDTIAMINNATAGLPADATATDLSRKVLEHMAGIKENPYEMTLEFLKKDIHKLFQAEA